MIDCQQYLEMEEVIINNFNNKTQKLVFFFA